ncbi:MAG: GNAT family N-acetyltransferase [Pseudomonadota bacterium]
MADIYTFRQVTSADLPLLARWRARPHVAEWWDSDEPDTEEELADPRVSRWIVSTGDEPFAYMQDYTVHGWEAHHFGHFAEWSRGIDQFIGEPGMLGKGHGSAFIATRVRALFAAGAPLVATDPDPDNARAIASYKKAGFCVDGPPQRTRWGVILPMSVQRPE